MLQRAGLYWLRAIVLALVALSSQYGATSLSAQEAVQTENSSSTAVASVLEEGRALEASRDWAAALAHYEEALRTYRGDPVLLERHDLAKLHYSLGRRYTDSSFVQAVQSLPARSAYELYMEVLTKLHTHYVETPPWRNLVVRGTKALDVALLDPTFRQRHLSFAEVANIDRFRREIFALVSGKAIQDRNSAALAVADIARAAQARIGLGQTAVYLEYVAAAAGGLDDYSAFLTADQLKDTYSQIEGNFVGLGVELKADNEGLLIVKVIRGSPAARAGIRGGDHITRVDGRPTVGITTDEAASLLAGEEGSIAQVVVAAEGAAPRSLSIRREHVEVPSIEEARIADANLGVAYIRLPVFQKTTSRDLEAALWDLHGKGMRHLILDLRGNPGGLLTSAVEVADKFVQEGAIVYTRGRNVNENFDYSARRVGTWRVPLTVLIDKDSASASEIFAGAIRDHRRGTIIGETSYGKGSVQGIFPLGIAGTGLRLTTAKFLSPSGKPISTVGVNPDVAVREAARPTPDGLRIEQDANDAVMDAALQSVRQQLAAR
jgi:carboxyl-terminal processing protease